MSYTFTYLTDGAGNDSNKSNTPNTLLPNQIILTNFYPQTFLLPNFMSVPFKRD